ncbi:MAG: nucleotidyltransferase family protein, partial [Parahaliea sp.]
MTSLLTRTLRDPSLAGRWSPAQWAALVPQARTTRLLATLCQLAGGIEGGQSIPPEVWRHLSSGWTSHRKQCADLNYEVQKVGAALVEAGEELVVLKGAAYILAGLEAAGGRMISDIDILVREEKLPAVEAALARHGWSAGNIHPYDERYYRQWMHEIPPLGHRQRQSVLDVHHTILPPTSDGTVDARALWEATVEVAPGVRVLGPGDMVLHSATHLFHEGEFHQGLRDLLDLDRLLRQFAREYGDDFYRQLIERARYMGLTVPLYYAL